MEEDQIAKIHELTRMGNEWTQKINLKFKRQMSKLHVKS